MKITRFVATILFLVFLSAALTGCMATYAENTEVLRDDLKITSDAIDTLAFVGLGGTSLGNHGAHQTRAVSVSSGTYIGVSVEPDIKFESSNGERYMAVMLRVNKDGSVERLYTDFTLAGSTTVCMMADKNEDIWMWCGWSEGTEEYLQLKLWHYDVSEDSITSYETIQKIGGYGYGSSIIEAENGKIYGIMNGGGGIGGAMAWCEFDIEAKEWKKAVVLDTDYRFCYHYSYADGNGGFITVAERDVLGQSVPSDIAGLNVADAILKLRSRWIDSNGVWDELYLFHVKDPSVAEASITLVEEATYDVANGIYPRVLNVYNDVLLDKNGNFHVLYTIEDDGVAGVKRRHKIYDVSDDMKLIYEGDAVGLYGANVNYGNRFFEDIAGNVYIFASCSHARAQMEDLSGMGNVAGAGAFIIANSRSNSIPSNTASVLVAQNETWYAFSIDLTNLAN